jgi:hypothetical protein
MDFRLVVNASVERDQGKFSTREDIEGQLIEAVEGADPGSITGENDGEYSVTDWSVEAEEVKTSKKPKKDTAILTAVHAMQSTFARIEKANTLAEVRSDVRLLQRNYDGLVLQLSKAGVIQLD